MPTGASMLIGLRKLLCYAVIVTLSYCSLIFHMIVSKLHELIKALILS